MAENSPETLAEETTVAILEQLEGVDASFVFMARNDEVWVRAFLTSHPMMVLDIGVVDLWLDDEYVSHEVSGFDRGVVLEAGEHMKVTAHITESEIQWMGPGLPELHLRMERA